MSAPGEGNDAAAGTADVNKVAQVQAQVEEAKGIMQDNIDTILKTHDNLESLQDKTDNLRTEAHSFQKQSTALKRQMYIRNCKLNAIIGLVICVILAYILIPIIRAASATGGNGDENASLIGAWGDAVSRISTGFARRPGAPFAPSTGA